MQENNLLGMKNIFKVFLDGILFFFSLGSNPLKKYKDERDKTNDADNIARDWQNVGNDIRNAYEKYRTCSGIY